MKTHTLSVRRASTWLTAAFLTWTLVSVGACKSDDDNPSPSKGGKAGSQGGSGGGAQSGGAKSSGGTGNAAGESGDAGSGATGADGGAAGGGGAPSGGGNAEGGANVAGGGGDGGTGPENACPATDLEFLNRPSESQTSTFPNTRARLPLLNADGSLPPLPGA